MRLRKGSKVEVLSRREVPSGSWFCAEIVSGNGQCYNVKYDHCLSNGDCLVEKVQGKDIRPRPSPMVGLGNWAPFDIVEFFENNSWKPAKIIHVLDGGNNFVVVIIGSSKELEVYKSNIRSRLSWTGNRWNSVDEEAEKMTEGKLKIPTTGGKVNHQRLQKCVELKNHKGDDTCVDGHYQISLRGLKKRSRICLLGVETNTRAGARRKIGAVRKEGKRRLPKKGQSWRPAKLASVGPRCCGMIWKCLMNPVR